MDDVWQPTPRPAQPADADPAGQDLAAFLAWQADNPPPEDYYRIFMDGDAPVDAAEMPAPARSDAARRWAADHAAALQAWTDRIDRHGMPDDDLRRV